MAEWSIAAVLKTVELRGSGGSNPSLSAKSKRSKEMSKKFDIFLFCNTAPRKLVCGRHLSSELDLSLFVPPCLYYSGIYFRFKAKIPIFVVTSQTIVKNK